MGRASEISCAPIRSAANPSTPLLAAGEHSLRGLVPDGVQEVRLRDAAGDDVAIRGGGNVIVAEADTAPETLTWTSAEGGVQRADVSPFPETSP